MANRRPSSSRRRKPAVESLTLQREKRRHRSGHAVCRPFRDVPTTADLQQAFLTAYADNGTITGAAEIARIAKQSHYQWLNRDPAYADRFAAAHQAAIDRAETELRRRGISGVERPVFHKGKVCGYVREYSDACLIFYLKGRRRDIFGEKVEHTGIDGGPIQTVDLSRLTLEQLQTMRRWLVDAQNGNGNAPALALGT